MPERSAILRRAALLTASVSLAAFGLVHAAPATASLPGSDGGIAYDVLSQGVRAIVVYDGGSTRPLVQRTDLDSVQPAWGPNGTRLAFSGETESDGSFAIFVADADGNHIEQSTQTDADAVPTGTIDSKPTWSPNGEEIAFQRKLPGIEPGIYVVEISSGTVRKLTTGNRRELEPAWSPTGDVIAYVSRPMPQDCPECGHLYLATVADGSTRPLDQIPATSGVEMADPDWMPDGGRVLVTLLTGGESEQIIGVDRSGNMYPALGRPSFEDVSVSPSGHHVAVEFRQGVVAVSDLQGSIEYGLPTFDNTAADAAWRPYLDTAGPSIAFDPPPSTGWYERSPLYLDFLVDDDSGVDRSGVSCDASGTHITIYLTQVNDQRVWGTVQFPDQGEFPLTCSAVDEFGNRTVVSPVIRIDSGFPVVSDVSIPGAPVRSDAVIVVSASVQDGISGVRDAVFSLGDLRHIVEGAGPLASLGTTFGPGLPADVYPFEVQAHDRAGHQTTVGGSIIVVYDPSAGSASGTGWIVPGGGTSDPRDHLASGSLDGKTKAAFSFSAKYKAASSTTPTGFFNLSYGNGLKLQSKSLEWLAAKPGDTVYLQGTASIQGSADTWRFRATITDGASSGKPDRLLVSIWPASGSTGDYPAYQLSGDAGGQIQIVR